jgi:hypothetical protein
MNENNTLIYQLPMSATWPGHHMRFDLVTVNSTIYEAVYEEIFNLRPTCYYLSD